MSQCLYNVNDPVVVWLVQLGHVTTVWDQVIVMGAPPHSPTQIPGGGGGLLAPSFGTHCETDPESSGSDEQRQ